MREGLEKEAEAQADNFNTQVKSIQTDCFTVSDCTGRLAFGEREDVERNTQDSLGRVYVFVGSLDDGCSKPRCFRYRRRIPRAAAGCTPAATCRSARSNFWKY